jgi:hypothetical protein
MDSKQRKRQTPLWIAVSLLVLTIGLGAARIASHSSPIGGGDGGGSQLALRFQAPGGGTIGFSGGLDKTAVLAGGDGLVRIELAIRGDASAAGTVDRMPSDLVVVLDQSGSMAGEKILHARAAIRRLISALEPEDRFALVKAAPTSRAVSRWGSTSSTAAGSAGGSRA